MSILAEVICLFFVFLLNWETAYNNNNKSPSNKLPYIYKTTHLFDIARQIAWVRYEEVHNETEGRVKSSLVTNECNLLCYIKTSVWFCIYYIRYMFFSDVELFWYAFRIRNASENVQASNKMASKINVATDNVTSPCFYVKVRQIFR